MFLDELDHIASTPATLNSLFTFIQAYKSHVRLIGIANTHTLSSASPSLSSALSSSAAQCVETVHFAPYTAAQLRAIIDGRLASLDDNANPGKHIGETKDEFLPKAALMLLCKKVASMTGDVRAAMEVLRGAIDIAVNTRSQTSENPLAESTAPVTPAHILSALKAYAPAKSVTPATPTAPREDENPFAPPTVTSKTHKASSSEKQTRMHCR